MNIAEINTNHIKHNINYFKKVSGTDIMIVLKANAYGHGAIEISKLVRKIGIKYIGVSSVEEAIILRKNGDRGYILAWLYNINQLNDAFTLNINIAIFNEKMVPTIINLIKKQSKKVKITIFVDTGLNRTGISYDKAIEIAILLNKCTNIVIDGLMSHLICSEVKNSPIIYEQLRKFRELRNNLKNIGINPPLIHIANTDACINYDVSDFTISRIGCGIFGIPNRPNKSLKIAMSVISSVIYIKNVKKGDCISYDYKYIVPYNMLISIIPIGYADILFNTDFHVYINGTKRKILYIFMDQMVIKSKISDKLNDKVYIFGDRNNCPQTIYHLGKQFNCLTSLTHIGNRVNRVYV